MRLRVVWLCAGALTTLVACGRGEAAPDSGCVSAESVRAAVPSGGVPALAIAAEDDRFLPGCIEAPAGELLLVVRNEGRHPHNLTVPDGKGVSVDAGQVAMIVVSVEEEELTYVCTLHAGMTGRIRVVG